MVSLLPMISYFNRGGVVVKQCVCKRCGHKWIPRLLRGSPVMCPACKSRLWNQNKDDKHEEK